MLIKHYRSLNNIVIVFIWASCQTVITYVIFFNGLNNYWIINIMLLRKKVKGLFKRFAQTFLGLWYYKLTLFFHIWSLVGAPAVSLGEIYCLKSFESLQMILTYILVINPNTNQFNIQWWSAVWVWCLTFNLNQSHSDIQDHNKHIKKLKWYKFI